MPSDLFFAGNCLHVHDLADNVTEEGMIAGRAAALFTLQKTEKRDHVGVFSGHGVRYVLPQIAAKGQPFDLYFRVDKVYQKGAVQIKAGDAVKVTVRFNAVTLVESEAQEANLKGTITRIVQESTGSTIEVRLEDGTTAAYSVTSGVSITAGGKAVALSALRVGYRLSMLVSGDRLIAVEVDSTAAAADKITGTVLFVNTSDKTILLQVSDSSIVTVGIKADTRLITVTGDTFTLYSLAGEAGKAEIEAYGQYDGLEFTANVVLKK